MKTQRLAFSQLHEELEVLERGSLTSIKGGNVPNETEWGTVDGVVYKRTPGGEWEYVATLNEVTISVNQGTAPSGFDWGNLFSLGWASNMYNNLEILGLYGGGGTGGSGTGSGGGGNSGLAPANSNLIASGQSGVSVMDIIGTLNTSLGLAATFASSSALAMQLESAASFVNSSRLFGAFDILTNTYELLFTEQDAAHKAEDVGQIVFAIVLFGAGPVGAVVGGIVLAGWELYEMKRDSPIY